MLTPHASHLAFYHTTALPCPLSSHTRVFSLLSHKASHNISYTPSKGHYFSNVHPPFHLFGNLLRTSSTPLPQLAPHLPSSFSGILPIIFLLLSPRIALVHCLLKQEKHHLFPLKCLIFPVALIESLFLAPLHQTTHFYKFEVSSCTLSCHTRERSISSLSIKWSPWCILFL